MRLKSILATGAVVIVAAVCFVGGANIGPMLGFGASQQETAPVVTVDTTLVKNSFADIGELATESYVFTQVGKYSEEGAKFFGMEVPGTSAHYLITYSGEVKAGLTDVSQIQVQADEGDHVVTVTVPTVEILSSSIDPASIETYDQSFSIVNQIEVSEVTSFLADREAAAKDEAVAKGLLDKAQNRLKEVVKGQVNAVLGERASAYEVRVTLAEEPGA